MVPRGCIPLFADVVYYLPLFLSKMGRPVQDRRTGFLGSLIMKRIEQPFSNRLKYDVLTIGRLKLSSSWTNT